MPQITTPDGVTVYVPGTYTTTEVVSDLPGPLPAFQIPVILGSADYGRPYNVASIKIDSLEPEIGADGFVLCGNPSQVARRFGRGSGVHIAAQFAWRHGLPFAFVVSLSALTRATVVVQGGEPLVDEANLVPRDFGAIPAHVLVQNTGGVFTTTPVKAYAPVVQDASNTDTRLYLRDHSWVNRGQSVTVGSNVATNVVRVVVNKGEEVGADGRPLYWIELSATPGFAIDASLDYAYVLVYDTTGSRSYAYTSGTDLRDAINGDPLGHVYYAPLGTFAGNVPTAVSTATALKDVAEWGSVTNGTSPAASPSDVTAFVTQMNAQDWVGFVNRFRLLPQAYLLAMPESAAHLTMRDYGIAERTRGFPISVTTGGDWGDVVLDAGDDTDPLTRTAALNSQDVSIWAGGLDYQPPCLSFAAAVFGRRVRGGPGHNLTQDDLVFSSVEVRWDQIGALEEDRLTRGGVGFYRLAHYAPFPFVVSQGLNTLQNNAGPVWDEQTAQTWSVHQRDLADYVERVLKEDLNRAQLGGDSVDARSIQAVLKRRGDDLARRGFIQAGSHVIVSIQPNAAGSGWDVVQRFQLPQLSDYITIANQILLTVAA